MKMLQRLLLPFCSLLGALFILGGCSHTRTSGVPNFLRDKIRSDNSYLALYPLGEPRPPSILCFIEHRGSLFAGTSTGVYQYDGTGAWIQKSNGLGEIHIKHLASVGDTLVAGSDADLYQSSDNGSTWTGEGWNAVMGQPGLLKINGLLSIKGVVITGTSGGVYRSEDGGKTWQPGNEGLLGRPRRLGPNFGINIQNILRTQDKVFAQLGNSFIRSDDLGKSWQQVKNPKTLFPDVPEHVASNYASECFASGEYIFCSMPFDNVACRSDDYGESWQRVDENTIPGLFTDWVTSGDLLSTSSDKVLYRSQGGGNTWVKAGRVPSGTIAIKPFRDEVFVGTASGVFRSPDWGGKWFETSNGLRAGDLSHLSGNNNSYFVITGTSEVDRTYQVTVTNWIYKSEDEGKSWKPLATPPAWQPLATPPAVNSPPPRTADMVRALGGALFVSTERGFYRTNYSGESWQKVHILPPSASSHKAPIEIRFVYDIGAASGALYALTGYGVIRSYDQGITWEQVNQGLNISGDSDKDEQNIDDLWTAAWIAYLSPDIEERKTSAIATVKDTVYLRTPDGIYRFNTRGETWERSNEGIVGPVSVLAAGGNVLLACTPVSGSEPPNIFKADAASSKIKWSRLRAEGLTGTVLSLWVDNEYPEVIIVGTTAGLFWSNDGGESFRQHDKSSADPFFTEVNSLNFADNRLVVGTDGGLFYAYDRIPRGNILGRIWRLIKDNPGLSIPALFTLAVLLFLSTRLILLFLQLEVWPITVVAPWFYLTTFGRWKLYRRYRRSLLADQEMIGHAERYVDLPYHIADEVSEDSGGTISERIIGLQADKRVTVIAEGGRGKTTLCHHLALKAAEGRMMFGRRGMVPVVIDGLSYSGEFLETVTTILKQHRAYVNTKIVSSQLGAGYLFVLLDGFSEIREAHMAAAESTDIPQFIRSHPDTPYLLTSRSILPPTVMSSLGTVTIFRLKDVDVDTERVFLAQYLKRESDADTLLQEINLRFPSLPRIPLMLKLVATVYDRAGAVPNSLNGLFSDYSQYLLRPAATGIDEPAGLNFAIRHLVRETFLRSGGDRGLTLEKGEEVLGVIKERLENYDINISPIKLLNMLTRAGLYRRIGENLKFFHDSFESYFAARALESDYRNKRYELITECARNERLHEAWDFLCSSLAETNEISQLKEIMAQAGLTPELLMLEKMREYQQVLDEISPHYRVVLTSEGEIILKPKYEGAEKEHPIQLPTRIRFPNTPEGRELLKAFEQQLRTGGGITIPSHYLDQFEVPEALIPFLSSFEGEGELTIGPRRWQHPILAKIEFDSGSGDGFTLQYVHLEGVQAGSEEVTLTNENQPVPWKFRLVINFTHKQLGFNCEINYGEINAKLELDARQLQMAIAKGGTIRIEHLDTGFQLVRGHIAPSSLPMPDPAWMEMLGDVVFIQQKTRVPLNVPDDVSPEVALTIYETARKLETGKATIYPEEWKGDVDLGLAKDLLSIAERDETFPFRITVEEKVQIFGTEILLGPVTLTCDHTYIPKEDMEKLRIALRNPPRDGFIHVRMRPLDNHPVQAEYTNWQSTESDTSKASHDLDSGSAPA